MELPLDWQDQASIRSNFLTNHEVRTLGEHLSYVFLRRQAAEPVAEFGVAKRLSASNDYADDLPLRSLNREDARHWGLRSPLHSRQCEARTAASIQCEHSLAWMTQFSRPLLRQSATACPSACLSDEAQLNPRIPLFPTASAP
jgi:hypothetical protein